MQTRDLGKTGLNVSVLGFGAEALGRSGRPFADAERTLNAVLDLGVTLIDTAPAYGNSEKFIGRAIGRRKQEFSLVTKCGWTGDYQAAWSPLEIEQTIDSSLRDLQLDCLDVLLLHSCGIDELKRGEVTAAIQTAKSQGKARFIGYSGDNEALDFAVHCGAFDVIECSFNMLDQANAPMIEEAREGNLGVLIKRPIANAVPGRTEKPRSEYAAQYWPRWQAMAKKMNSKDLGGIPWLEAAIRFTAFWPGVHCALVGSSHAEHMATNAEQVARGELSKETIERLRSAYQKVEHQWQALG